MKPYSEYKDSGVEWIREIPAYWDFMILKRVTYEHRQGYYTTEDYIDEGVKLIRISDLDENGNIYYENMPYVKITEKDENVYQVQINDFLFPRTGSVGLFGLVRKNVRSVFASYLINFRFNNKTYSNFLKYYFYSNSFKAGIYSSLHGGVNQNIHAENIKSQTIALPPIPGQKQIAKYLDHKTAKIDYLIEKKKRLIELLKEERTAVINEAVTKGLDPNVPMKDSGIEWLGQVPKHWEVKKLKHFTRKITDGEHISPNFQSEGMPFLSAKDVRERTINFDGNKFVSIEDGIKCRKRCDPLRGDVLLVSRGATIGRIGLVETDDTFCLLGSVILLKPLERGSSLLLYYVLNNFRIQEQLLLTSQSSAQQAIYLVGVSELLIPIPPANEQPLIIKHIEKETTRIDSIISKSEKEIELLQEYRTALISEAVTGKIDVREETI